MVGADGASGLLGPGRRCGARLGGPADGAAVAGRGVAGRPRRCATSTTAGNYAGRRGVGGQHRPGGSGVAFQRLDAALGGAIDGERAAFDDATFGRRRLCAVWSPVLRAGTARGRGASRSVSAAGSGSTGDQSACKSAARLAYLVRRRCAGAGRAAAARRRRPRSRRRPRGAERDVPPRRPAAAPGVHRLRESLRPDGPVARAGGDAARLDDGDDRRARPADRRGRPGQLPRRLPRPADRASWWARTSTSSARSRRRSSATRTGSSSWCSTSPTGRPLQRGEVDIVVNHFTVTCARQRTVEFSTAYMAGPQRAAGPGRQRRARGRGPGRAAGVHLARLDDRGRAARAAAAAGRGRRGAASRTAWSSCSGAGWPRSPATT